MWYSLLIGLILSTTLAGLIKTKYISKNLVRGERVIFYFKQHYFILVKINLFLNLGLWGLVEGYDYLEHLQYWEYYENAYLVYLDFILMMYFSFIGLAFFIKACMDWVQMLKIDSALTNYRVYCKQGVFEVEEENIALQNLRRVVCKKGTLGAIFNFGTLTIIGKNKTLKPIFFVSNPKQVRQDIIFAVKKIIQRRNEKR